MERCFLVLLSRSDFTIILFHFYNFHTCISPLPPETFPANWLPPPPSLPVYQNTPLWAVPLVSCYVGSLILSEDHPSPNAPSSNYLSQPRGSPLLSRRLAVSLSWFPYLKYLSITWEACVPPVFVIILFCLRSRSISFAMFPLDVFPLRVYMHNVLFFTVSFVLYA